MKKLGSASKNGLQWVCNYTTHFLKSSFLSYRSKWSKQGISNGRFWPKAAVQIQRVCVGGSFYFSNMLRQLSNNSLQIFLNFPFIKGAIWHCIFFVYTHTQTQ
jgi:hypothetical protein